MRWRNADGSYRYPKDFIPIFEENGFCTNLDMYMVEQACEQIRAWIDAGVQPIPISGQPVKDPIFGRKLPEPS